MPQFHRRYSVIPARDGGPGWEVECDGDYLAFYKRKDQAVSWARAFARADKGQLRVFSREYQVVEERWYQGDQHRRLA
jgi:hypothetical protein